MMQIVVGCTYICVGSMFLSSKPTAAALWYIGAVFWFIAAAIT